MWNCVEDRVEGKDRMYSRVIRKLIFDEIYSDRNAVLGQKPIPKKILTNLKVKTKTFNRLSTPLKTKRLIISETTLTIFMKISSGP